MLNNRSNTLPPEIMVVYDGPVEEETAQKLILGLPPNILITTGKQLGVGGAKNFGVDEYRSLEYEAWGEDIDPKTVLMFSDNDMYYLPGWDKKLETALNNSSAIQIGGWKHPYHHPAGKAIGVLDGLYGYEHTIVPVDAVTGNCFVIRYKDWLKYGPFDANAIGPGQSEDFALSRRILDDGGSIATLDPPVAIHCGLRDSSGNPAVGWVEMSAMVEQQLKTNNINKLWLEVPDEGTIFLEKNDSRELESPSNSTSINQVSSSRFSGLNVGSGQRRFDNRLGWINCDHVSRPPDQIPDMVVDGTKLVEHFGESTQDIVVLHHVIEHFGCGEADEVLVQCFKCLKSGGSLLIFVPDLRKLAGRWLSGELDDFSYFVNVYGAYQGLEGDRHKWGYDINSLHKYLKTIPGTGQIKLFDWREIPGADIARDWWILGMEIVKA